MSWRSTLALLFVLIYRSITFVLSHAGLAAIVVAYCLLGGIVFETLEKDHEIHVKNGIKTKRDDLANQIWTFTEQVHVLRQDLWVKEVERSLKHFELELIRSIKQEGWNGDESHSNIQWTFGGALFYSVICITTIGYGDQTPKTPSGKLATILYSVFGIPLMLFCLKTTGDALAYCFRFIYWRICCYLCQEPIKPQRSRAKRLSRQRSTRSLPMHFCRLNSNNSGGGGNNVNLRRSVSVRSCNENRRGNSVRIKRPNSVYLEPSFALDNVGPAAGSLSRAGSMRLAPPAAMPRSASTQRLEPELALLIVDDVEEEPQRNSNKEVPLWICGTLIVGYVLGGSALFSGWEGWNLLDSAYFCFVTLTTIGFGDFVPKESNVTHSKWSIAASSVYLLLGVSLLFMTFNLVQAQVVFYVRNIALKLGIIRNDDDLDND